MPSSFPASLGDSMGGFCDQLAEQKPDRNYLIQTIQLISNDKATKLSTLQGEEASGLEDLKKL